MLLANVANAGISEFINIYIYPRDVKNLNFKSSSRFRCGAARKHKDLRWVNRKLNKILSLSKGKWIVLTNFRVVCGVVTNKLNVTEYS